MTIGPTENSPLSALRVRSRKYPPAELMWPPRSEMHPIAIAAFSGLDLRQYERGFHDGNVLGPFLLQLCPSVVVCLLHEFTRRSGYDSWSRRVLR
jgi:hypothetical protein